jgi:predicted Zn-dependent protease
MGLDAEAAQVARRFLALSSDERAKLQLLRSLANDDNRVADNLRYSRALYQRFPNERIMKFWLASPLSLLGEHRQAAQLMTSEPVTQALLASDWQRFAKGSEQLGRRFWDRAFLWSSAKLLVASGHSDVLVKLYDEVQPLIRSGRLNSDNVAIPETAMALRQAGRQDEADRVLKAYARNSAKLPAAGIGNLQHQIDLAVLAALAGRNDTALDRLDSLSRHEPLALATIPAMSLTNNPSFGAFRNDPRLLASDERLRAAINSERAKSGMSPIGREAWTSDPKTLLTKN